MRTASAGGRRGGRGNDEETEGGAALIVGGEGLDWSCRLMEVQRIEVDLDDDDLNDLFSVTFVVDGPHAEGSLEIMVPDAADIEVVAVALDTLHGALVAWAEPIR